MAGADVRVLVGVARGGADGNSEELMRSELESIMHSISANPPKIEVTLGIKKGEIEKIREEIQRSLSSATFDVGAKVVSATSGVGTQTSQVKKQTAAMRKELQEIIKLNAQAGKAIDSVSDMGNTTARRAQLEQIKQEYAELLEYTELLQKSGIVNEGDAQGLAQIRAEIQGVVTELQRAKTEAEAFRKAREEIAATASRLESGMAELEGVDTSKWAESERAELEQLVDDWHKYKNAVEKAQNQETSFEGENGLNDLKRQGADLEALIAKVSKYGDTAETAAAKAKSWLTLIKQISSAMQNWTAAKNGKSSDQYAQLQGLLNDAQTGYRTGGSEAERERISQSFLNIGSAIRAAGEDTRTFRDRLSGLASKFASWLTASQIIMTTIRVFKQMVQASAEVDKALTQIEIVTGTSGSALRQFASDAATAAKAVGASMTDIISSTETYARLGYTLDESLGLSELTSKYANVAATTVDAATSALTSIMKGFGLQASDMEGVVDMLVKVGQEYAVSASELGEALMNGGAALSAAGNSIEESIALIAAGNAAVQDASAVGNALKTTSMRIRSSTTELEEMGEEVDDLVKSASDYRKEIMALAGVDIMADENTYKSTYQILREIAAVWDQMTDIQQATLLEDLAGKRNASTVKSVIQNLADLEGAYDAASNASGTLAEANDVYMDSIQAKASQFKATFQEFSSSLIDSGLAKGVVDLGNGLMGFLTILEKAGVLIPAVTAAIIAFRAAAAVQTAQASTLTISTLAEDIFQSAEKITMTNAEDEVVKRLRASVIALSAAEKEELNSKLTAMVASGQITAERQREIAATLELAGATRTAEAAQESLSGKQILKTMLGDPMAIISAVMMVVSIVTSIVQAVKQAREEARRAAREAGEQFSENASSIEDYKTQISELRTALDSGNLSEQEAYEKRSQLLSIQDEIVDKLGAEAAAFDVLHDSIDSVNGTLDTYSSKEAANLLLEHKEYQEANDAMMRTRTYGGFLFNNRNMSDDAKRIREIYTQTFKDVFGDAVSFSEDMYGNVSYTLNATAEDAASGLREVSAAMSALKKEGFDNDDLNRLLNINDPNSSWEGFLVSGINKAQKVIDDFNENAKLYVQLSIFEDNDYYEIGQQIDAIKNAYREALAKEDGSAIQAAYADMLAIAPQIEEIDNAAVRDYFSDLIAAFNAESELDLFRISLHADVVVDDVDVSDLSSKVQAAVAGFADQDGVIHASDILSFGQDLSAAKASGNTGRYAPDQTKLAAYYALEEAASHYGITVNDLVGILTQEGVVTGAVADVMDDAAVSIEQFAEKAEKAQSGLSALNTALSEQSENGYISLDTYDKLIAESSDYADCLEFEGGYMRLNEAAARELANTKAELAATEIEQQKLLEIQQWKENTAAIEELQSATDDLTAAQQAELERLLAENEGIEANVARYNVMKSELLELTGAYQEWVNARKLGTSKDTYDSLLTARQDITDALSSGATGRGNYAYQAAVKLLIPEPERGDVQAYLDTLDRYLMDGTDGLNNFLSDMISSGFMNLNEDGTITMVGEQSLEAICDAMKITPEMARAIFNALETYGFEFNWTDEDFNFDVDTDALDEALADADARIADLQEQIDNMKLEGLDITNPEAFQELTSELESAVEMKDRLTEEKEFSLQESEDTRSALEEVSENLDDIAEKVDEVSAKKIGTLGAADTIYSLNRILLKLDEIDRKKISNKTFTVTQQTIGNSGAGLNQNQTKADGGISPGGRTLVGELGPELVVSGDHYYTVGDLGAEFVHLKPGDIVFNHKDTERILQGRSGARGTALVQGNAMAGISGGGNGFIGGNSGNGSNNTANVKMTNTATVNVNAVINTASLEEQLKDTLDEMEEQLEKILGNFEHRIFMAERNNGSLDSIVAYYKAMQKAVHDQAEKYRSMGLTEESEYVQDLEERWWEYYDAIGDAVSTYYDKIVNEHKNAITLLENDVAYAVGQQNFRSAERDTNAIVAHYKAMQEAVHKEAEYYRKLGYSDTSDEVSALSDLWWDYADEIKSVKQQIIDDLLDVVKEASDAIDDIQDAFSTFQTAAEEYASTGGYLTIDTFQKIIDLGPEYLSLLYDESGRLVINEQMIRAVTKARVNQLGVEQALAYVERLRMALQKDSIEDLQALLAVTVDATNANWNLVYSNLALLDLTDSQRAAAEHNIDAIYSITQAAIDGIDHGIDGLDSMKSGLDDILKYVMDMLKDGLNQQIDALKDQVATYKDIVSLQKESLKNAKEEDDYQKSKAKKLKEIAKIQAQIDALSLDDSRAAQAQRAKLQEELAELQEEVADDVREHQIDAQTEALDQMADAYEAEKDKEIKALEDSLSSQQKLYDAAIAYIQDHWDTLYDELIAWNTEYGSVLNSEIASAWDKALEAAKRYGSYVAALNAVNGTSDTQASSPSGSKIVANSSTWREQVSLKVGEMWDNSQAWNATTDKAERNRLAARNLEIANTELAALGIKAVRGDDGVWYIDKVGGADLYDTYPEYVGRRHSGGVVDGNYKDDERFALLQKDEWVLTKDMADSLMKQIEMMNALKKAAFSTDFGGLASIRSDILTAAGRVSNITNNRNQPIEITFGDTIINGADSTSVQKHIQVSEGQVNQIARILGFKM